jgi:hypothetical protein
MADVWVLLLIVAFFAVCIALVRGCDRIIGPDEAVDAPPSTETQETEITGAAR